jgi:hypothetical protein
MITIALRLFCPRVSIGLEKLNRFNGLGPDLLSVGGMEPIWASNVHYGAPMTVQRNSQEIMKMQQPAQAAPSKSIPQHVLDRMESEWKEIRENSSRQPNQR